MKTDRCRLSFFLFILLISLTITPAPLLATEYPPGFVKATDVIPGVVLDVRYYTAVNFVGARIDGYLAPVVILTKEATQALAKVQAELKPFGLGLKLFDGYRPEQAVLQFERWAKDLSDTRTKHDYYPNVAKEDLIPNGYIAAKSSHSRGSTVDVTIVGLDTGLELPMGTPFDHFGVESWSENEMMSVQVRANRALLRNVMTRHGFKPLKEEWWHFTLANEPFPETYFDFPVQ